MMWDDSGWGMGGWLVMSLAMVVFWGGLIALGVWLVRSLSPRDTTPPAPPAPKATPDEILAARFARGEIDATEFQRRRNLMHSGG